MMLLVISVSAMLFEHQRSRVLTPPLVPTASTSLTVITDRSSTVPESLVSAMLAEASMIWKPLGVDVRGRSGAVSSQTPIVRVVVTDDPNGSFTDERLGWIRFIAPNQPEPVIYLSRLAARQLLDSAPAVRTRPETYQDVLLSRIMGRALAHDWVITCSLRRRIHPMGSCEARGHSIC